MMSRSATEISNITTGLILVTELTTPLREIGIQRNAKGVRDYAANFSPHTTYRQCPNDKPAPRYFRKIQTHEGAKWENFL